MDKNQFEELITSSLKQRWPGDQAVVVRAAGNGSPEAEMWLFEYKERAWRKAAGPWPAVVGKNGVSKRCEGDGKSPSGVFQFGPAFGRAEEPEGMLYPYRRLDASDLWVDSAGSPWYNCWVRGPESVCGSGERLSEVEQYQHAVALRYNDLATEGLGSAIFLHVWAARDRGTLGCTAISPENMENLLKWLDYSRRPVCVQGTEEQVRVLFNEGWDTLCLPPGWGFVDDFIPDARLDIRYFTENNFTGRRVCGYHAPLAAMRLESLKALELCASEFRRRNLGLRVYDAYRPQQATDAMLAWAEDENDTATKAEYYPGIDKAEIPGNYVARRSNHRLGGTVDLTLISWGNGENLDMGGPFDFFGELSSLGYAGLTGAQAANRALLREVMEAYGFKPLESEWWHFSYPVDGLGGSFSIYPREHALTMP